MSNWAVASLSFYIEAMHHGLHSLADYSPPGLHIISLLCLSPNTTSILIKDKCIFSYLIHLQVWWPPNSEVSMWFCTSFNKQDVKPLVRQGRTLTRRRLPVHSIVYCNYLFAKWFYLHALSGAVTVCPGRAEGVSAAVRTGGVRHTHISVTQMRLLHLKAFLLLLWPHYTHLLYHFSHTLHFCLNRLFMLMSLWSLACSSSPSKGNWAFILRT